MAKRLQRYKFVIELIADGNSTPILREYIGRAIEELRGCYDVRENPEVHSIANVHVKDYGRVLQAEKIKVGLRKKELHLRVKPQQLRNAIALMKYSVPYNELSTSSRVAVDDVAVIFEGGV